MSPRASEFSMPDAVFIPWFVACCALRPLVPSRLWWRLVVAPTQLVRLWITAVDNLYIVVRRLAGKAGRLP